jgi:hypothetical protein
MVQPTIGEAALKTILCVCVYVYIYIYIHTYKVKIWYKNIMSSVMGTHAYSGVTQFEITARNHNSSPVLVLLSHPLEITLWYILSHIHTSSTICNINQ